MPSNEINKDSTTRLCRVCEAADLKPIARINGYVRGQEHDIFECPSCRCQSSQPSTVPEGLYDAIYSNASRIAGGYDRYVRYADGVEKESHAFDWLADQEDMYWGVRQLFSSLKLAHGDSVIEIGSGLGYLTHALRSAGYDAHGIDLSPIAASKARQRFGNFFSAGDATESTFPLRAKVIVALELLEHLVDPAIFLARVRQVMHDRASLVISTPNRDTYEPSVVWNTDLPPVHLHWFSEGGLEQMSRRCGFTCTFADFTARNAMTSCKRWVAGSDYYTPRFDESLVPLARDRVSSPRWFSPTRVWASALRRTSEISRQRPQHDSNILRGRRAVTMVALLTPRV